MAKSIEPKLRKIGAYLKLEKETCFTIPEYQRPYSWNITNCDKLWQDIINFIDSKMKDPYFFGTIIINCQENDTKLDLIDGQQRTTTFLLLLKALLIRINIAIERTKSDEDSAILFRGLKERRRRIMSILYQVESEEISDMPEIIADKTIFENASTIIENNSINETFKSELYNILYSIDYSEAEKQTTKIPRKQHDNKYTNFFKNFKFFYEKATELHDSQLNEFAKTFIDSCELIEIKSWQVEQAITMFNSLNSDGLPLEDADIISAKLYAVAVKKELGHEFTEKWKELLRIVDDLKQNNIVSGIDAILMQQMYYERAIRKEMKTDSGSIDVTMPGLRRYYTEINPSLLNEPIKLCNQMLNISKIWQKVSNIPVIQILLKFNDNSKLFLASYFQRFTLDNITENDVNVMARCLLRIFAVLELVDTGFSSSAFKTFLFGEIMKIADTSVPISEIESDFTNHISDKWKQNEIKNLLIEYDKNILVYLNEYLFAQEAGVSLSLGAKYDIEHIMPASGSNIAAIRLDAQIDSVEEFEDIVNRLGNKILLESKINRAIGNEWFRTKVSKELCGKIGYSDSVYPLAQALAAEYQNQSNPSWNKKDIETATEKASDRIVKFIFAQ